MSTLYSQTSLTEDQVIHIIRENVEIQFPKDCAVCGHRFCSFKEYIKGTDQLGKPRSYDADEQIWQPHDPIGIFSFSKCKRCENTLTLDSYKSNVATIQQLLGWIKEEVMRRSIMVDELLDDLRVKVENQILNEE